MLVVYTRGSWGSTREEVGKVRQEGKEPIEDILDEWVVITVSNGVSLVLGAPPETTWNMPHVGISPRLSNPCWFRVAPGRITFPPPHFQVVFLANSHGLKKALRQKEMKNKGAWHRAVSVLTTVSCGCTQGAGWELGVLGQGTSSVCHGVQAALVLRREPWKCKELGLNLDAGFIRWWLGQLRFFSYAFLRVTINIRL